MWIRSQLISLKILSTFLTSPLSFSLITTIKIRSCKLKWTNFVMATYFWVVCKVWARCHPCIIKVCWMRTKAASWAQISVKVERSATNKKWIGLICQKIQSTAISSSLIQIVSVENSTLMRALLIRVSVKHNYRSLQRTVSGSKNRTINIRCYRSRNRIKYLSRPRAITNLPILCQAKRS